MESWLDQWEQKAGRATETEKVEVQTLLDTQLQLSEFIRRLHWFRDVKSVTGKGWFPTETSPELLTSLASQIDKSVDRLAYMRASVRADIELANMHNLRHQLEKTDQRQQADDKARAKSEEFQRNLSYLAAIFLAPSLVAAIYGANTELPGLNTWLGFALMLTLMVLAGGLALLAIGFFRDRQERLTQRREHDD